MINQASLRAAQAQLAARHAATDATATQQQNTTTAVSAAAASAGGAAASAQQTPAALPGNMQIDEDAANDL